MLIDDPALPAAVHLVGDGAAALDAAVGSFGGRVENARPCEVQYRHGHAIVVRYDATVIWNNGPAPRHETLIASTGRDGVPDGTVAVEAETEWGVPITVGVWRWPFDPALPGLAHAVTPRLVARVVAGAIREPFSITVRAYRPTERAVVRVAGDNGAAVFLKVLPPASIASLVERHRALHAAGVPVPSVVSADTDLGIVVLTALRGSTLREQLGKHNTKGWPASSAFREVFDGFARASLADTDPMPSRASTTLGHARLLRAIAPELADRLAVFDEPFTRLADRSAERAGPVIHGDLYDAQIFSARSRITGVLDVDDAGPGDPVDDRATVLGFLLAKSLHCDTTGRASLLHYVRTLRRGFCDDDIDPRDLDHATAAVLVGLATGPFRCQRANWRDDVIRHLDLAHHLLKGREPSHVTS